MIGKRIKNKIKNFELLKKKEVKKLANIGVITLLLLSVLSTLFLPYASPAFTADEVVTDDFTGSNWNVTGNVVHNATGGYIWVKSDYGAGLKEGNAWWYPQHHTSHPITNLTLQVNYTGEIDQTGSNLGSNEIFINITLTNETGTTTSSPQVMVHRADFDATYNETYTWNVVDIYQYRYVNISFYMAANATTDNLAWVTVRWLKLSLDTASQSNYTYAENFDDDTEGANPTETWYSYWENFDVGSVNATYYQSSPYSFKHAGGVSSDALFSYFNLSSALQPSWISMNIREISATAGNKFWMYFATDHDFYSGGDLNVRTNASASLGWVEGVLKYRETGDLLTDWNNYTGNTWVAVNFSFNWTDHTYRIDYGGSLSSWIGFPGGAGINNITKMVFITPASNSGVAYIDDIIISIQSANTPPTISNPSPSDGATDVSVNLSSWSCDISDADSDTMNWTIQTSPNVGSNSGSGASDGSISCSLSGLQYSTSYTVYVNVTDGTDWTNTTYTFTTESEPLPTPPSSGQPITVNDFLAWDGANINLKADILNDTANMTVLFTSDDYTGTGWHSNGGPSIAYDGSYYYIVHRERVDSTYRGRFLTLHKSSDLQTWTQVWRVNRSNITGFSSNSLERANIRYWNSSYYLYFCIASSSDAWNIYYVKSATASGLESLLLDSANWYQITASGSAKDPFVGEVNGKYYMVYNDYGSANDYIYVADNPEFNGKTQYTISSYSENPGWISYDNSSGKYIFWGSDREDPAIRWRFYISDDLQTWTSADSWIAISNSPESGSTGNARYQDYYAYNESSYIIIMEYDHDGDGDLETCLWNYSLNAISEFTDSGTAEPMTFPDTDINATDWVVANGNYLVITNNNKTIDGSTTWVMAFHPVLLNDTLLEYLTSPSDSTSWKCYAKIPEDDNVWHEVPASNSFDGWFYINDSIWDYSFDVGDHMYIRWAFNASNMTTSYAGVYSGSSAWNISDSPGYPSDYEYNLTVTLTGEQPPNQHPPIKPLSPTPSNGEYISEGEYSLMQCLVYDEDGGFLSVSFYWGNGTLIGTDSSVAADFGIASIDFPDVQVNETYTWYAIVDDGTYTNRSDNWTFTVSTGGEPPLVYSPSPANGATNISLLPTLSVLVYDTDSDSISVTFYDSNNITIGIDTFVNQMPPSPGQASVQWNNVIISNHTYEWYAVADDGDGNVVRYPTTGYLNFTTGITYPPVVTFQVKDTSGFPLSDVNISCSNLNQQILQYATTNTGGFASFSFNYNDIGQTYDFVFKKANYTTVKKTYTIATGQYYITLQHKATPSGGNTTNPTDIATIFVNYAQDSLGSTGLAFLSIILVILAMLIASKQFNAGNTATLFIGASLFGLFIALGWIPFWLLLLPFVLVALMFGGKIRDIIFGKSTGGDES